MIVVAIGGGEIGRPGTKRETIVIDKELISLSGKKKPVLTFIPTASGDSAKYEEVVADYFGKFLGCKVRSLRLLKEKLTQARIRDRILSSDIIYVGGGNTMRMIKVWKRTGVDAILKTAAKKNIILSGLSAGSICWFKGGCSDSRKMLNPKAPWIYVKGISLLPFSHNPHYLSKERKRGLREILAKKGGVMIAIDDKCAVIFKDTAFKVVQSSKKSFAYVCYYSGKKLVERKLPVQKSYAEISSYFIRD